MIKQFLVNKLFSNAFISRMNIGHLEIKSKNTLTTNKISLEDATINPTTNGEIQRNGNTVKAYFDGGLKNL